MVFALLGATLYGILIFGAQSQSPIHATSKIDLSLGALPRYAIFSAIRGLAAYLLSLVFTLTIGYWAARSKAAERIIIPFLDVGQSVPALGFLPGLVLGFTALFPNTTIGLEIAAVITIFTSQVWNMAFSFYNSLKSIPPDYLDVSSNVGLSWGQKFMRLELPFGAMPLAWNSVMSMAGGWFFLTVCEAFTIENQEHFLPGVGSYMAVAIREGNREAMVGGVIAMVGIILVLDLFLWRPILAIVSGYQTEDMPSTGRLDEPLMLHAMKQSRFLRWIRAQIRRKVLKPKRGRPRKNQYAEALNELYQKQTKLKNILQVWRKIGAAVGLVALVFLLVASLKLFAEILSLPLSVWLELFLKTLLSFLRVFSSIVLSSLWTIPVGIWIALSNKRIRVAQPIIQILASFPAPMLFPLIVGLCHTIGLPFGLTAVILMFFGVQWYVLFNVLAGAMRISQELRDTLYLANTPKWVRWKHLYFPSVFPSLVNGWVLAAGGAWNATIVSEYMVYNGEVLSTAGLGSVIRVAADQGNFQMLTAALVVMILVVVGLDRLFWARIYKLAQTRFRMD